MAGIDWTAVGTYLALRFASLNGASERLLHGRSGAFPGFEKITVDAYAPVIVIATFAPVPSDLIEKLVATLRIAAYQQGFATPGELCMMLQARDGPRTKWTTICGEPPDRPVAHHLGLHFELQLGKTQNVGIFLDMAEGHRLVQRLAPGKRILNLFAYTCVFSVVAIQAGATQVVNVDLSRAALEKGRRNHLRNGMGPANSKYLSYNVMKSMAAFRRMGPFDLVICDPPSFQAGRFQALRDYPKLVRHLPALLGPGGEVIACLNAPYLCQRNMLDWFQQPPFHLRNSYGRPESYREMQPNRDLKIHHFCFDPGQTQHAGPPS